MDFSMPTKLYCEENAVLRHSGELGEFGRRCLVVTGGKAAKSCGALEDMFKALDNEGIEYCVYDRVEPNPTVNCVFEGGRLAAQKGCEFVVGIGGGSPMDAAKAIAVVGANPGLDEEGLYSMSWPNEPLPIVLVGTTAGTGSEVTPVAVITASNGRKRSLRGDKIFAKLSFGDVRYTMSMPLNLTKSTAVDAWAHCMESYFSKKATDVSRGFAAEGMRQLLEPLKALAEGKLPDDEYRGRLYEGSILGGMAISITGTNLGHNLGYYMTETYNVPHGFACSMFLPALIRHAMNCVPDYANELFCNLGTNAGELIALLKKLTPDSGIRLSDEEIEALLPRWENVPNIKATVGDVTLEQIRMILKELFG